MLFFDGPGEVATKINYQGFTVVKIISVMLLSMVATIAVSKDKDRCDRDDVDHHRRCVASAPEVDPAMAGGALVLLGGAVAIIRARRGKKK